MNNKFNISQKLLGMPQYTYKINHISSMLTVKEILFFKNLTLGMPQYSLPALVFVETNVLKTSCEEYLLGSEKIMHCQQETIPTKPNQKHTKKILNQR